MITSTQTNNPFLKIKTWLLPLVFMGPFIFSPLALAQKPLEGKIILIDSGHGTLNYDGRLINPGKTTWNGIEEHHLTLQLATTAGDVLEKEGATVFYTRTPYDYWREAYSPAEDNKNRALFANEIMADVLISIHCDWHPNRRVQGVTTLYAKENSIYLGKEIQKSMIKTIHANNRKLKKDTFTILDHAEMPAVLLETGFLSHSKESIKLQTPSYQEKIALAISKAVQTYFREKS